MREFPPTFWKVIPSTWIPKKFDSLKYQDEYDFGRHPLSKIKGNMCLKNVRWQTKSLKLAYKRSDCKIKKNKAKKDDK